MIHWSLVVYILVTITFIVLFIKKLMVEYYGYFSKRKWEIDGYCFFIIIFWIAFSLIWGGIFLW